MRIRRAAAAAQSVVAIEGGLLSSKHVRVGDGALLGHGDSGTPNRACPGHLSSGLLVVGKGAMVPKDIQVGRGQVRTVNGTFSPADDASWVRARVRESFETHSLPTEVKELISVGCTRKNVSAARLVMLVDGKLVAATYEVALRRLGPG